MLWAVGYTSNGVPYGVSEEEMRLVEHELELNELRRQRGGAFSLAWRDAKILLETAFRELSAPKTRIVVGRVTSIGRGLSRRQFAATVELTPDPSRLSDAYVVGLPVETPGVEARLAAEIGVLEVLGKRDVPFRLPRVVRQPGAGQRASIRTFVPGVDLDLRAGRQPGVRPWQVVGELAAAVHQTSPEQLPKDIPSFGSREDSAAHQVHLLNRGRHHPEVARAIAWATASEPPRGAPTLIHGDLLGQNILLEPGEAPAIIDWEYCAIGDPAYDLAIVTRGVRRPFQIDRGMDRLLDAYRSGGGAPVAARDVHFYEVCLAAGWVCDALASSDEAMIAHAALPLQSLLRRIGA
jgi:aminoglycoside phosphotransferase (APT) family kinase protein